MYFRTLATLYLAALAAASPLRTSTSTSQDNTNINTRENERGLVTFVMTEPDCPAIKEYCTHCNGDFNCETDPRCEWCYSHHQFGN